MTGSAHAGVTGSSKLKHFDSKTKTFIEINDPDIITEYNKSVSVVDKSMGGVDLSDMLIGLYRAAIIIKKRMLSKTDIQ